MAHGAGQRPGDREGEGCGPYRGRDRKIRARRTWFRGRERALVIGKGKRVVNIEVGTEK